MQQSLQFLQAPAMELQSLVQQEIEINPVLEESPDEPKLDLLRAEAGIDQNTGMVGLEVGAVAAAAAAEDGETQHEYLCGVAVPKASW